MYRTIQLLFSMICLLCFLFTGSETAECREPWRIHTEEVWSIGGEDSDLIIQWIGLAVDHEGFIYLTDRMDYSLKKFSPHGELLARTGRRGQGPDEFLDPCQVACLGDRVYVSDIQKPGLSVYDRQLNYIGQIMIPYAIFSMQVLDSNTIWISSMMHTDRPMMMAFDSLGALKQSLFPHFTLQKSFIEMTSFQWRNPDTVHVVFHWAGRICRFHKDGKLIWENRALEKRKPETTLINDIQVPVGIALKNIQTDPHGYLFVLGGSDVPNPGRDIFVMDENGKLCGQCTLDESSHMILIDDKGYLYSRGDMGMSLIKQKLNYPEAMLPAERRY